MNTPICASFATLDQAKAFAERKAPAKEGEKMIEYTITIGEVGNEIGHETAAQYATDADAIKAAKKAVKAYNGDGWYKITCQGQTVAKSN